MSRYQRRQARESGRRDRQTTESGDEEGIRKRGTDFSPDYSYVRKDLKRIALLAGFFLAAMVGLSFFVN